MQYYGQVGARGSVSLVLLTSDMLNVFSKLILYLLTLALLWRALEIQLTTSEQHRYISANNNLERQCTHELRMAECNLGGSVMCLPQLILSFWRRGPPIIVCTVNTALCFTRDFFNVTSVMIVANLKKHNWREQIEETLHWALVNDVLCSTWYCNPLKTQLFLKLNIQPTLQQQGDVAE